MPTSPSPRSRRRSEDLHALSVRPASLADVDTIVRFRMELLKEYGKHPIYGRLRNDAPTRARRTTSLHLASGRQITYLALEGRTPVGMLRCLEGRGSPLLTPTRYAYIASVFVSRPHRRRGILTRLVDAAVTWARARGLTEVRLHSVSDHVASEAAWTKLGFPVVESLRRREITRTEGS